MEEKRMEEKYYIGGKQYVPSASLLLCSVKNTDELEKMVKHDERLYYSPGGVFFLIIKDSFAGTKVQLIDEDKAKIYLDKNSPGIILENYEKVLGVPEIG